ncbi:MAG: hypothetical protein Q8P24_16545, partial [Desulfobacterales bacterium]|nr:hypothetical protein [Desulfobacterales bacterium]
MCDGGVLYGHDTIRFGGISYLCREVFMKKTAILFVLVLLMLCPLNRKAHAALPTFDAVNAALSELRNAVMQSQFAQDIALAMERLNQLKSTYQELLRFHSGLDDLFETWVGDPLHQFLNAGQGFQFTFPDFPAISPQIDLIQNAQGPSDIRNALENITGKIPQSEARPYILFEEMQVVEGLDLAQKIRQSGENTR